MTVSLNTPRGMTFVRGLIAAHYCKSADPESLQRFAVANWGAHSAERITKAAVSALGTGDFGNPDVTEFFTLVRDQSVIGRLASLRRVPFNIRMLAMVNGAQAHWVGQAKRKPLSKPSLAGATLQGLKVVALIATTQESVQANPQAEQILLTDLRDAVIGAIDEAFLDPANAGIADVMPAAVTYGATAITATSDAAADIAALIDAFGGSFESAYFVTDGKTATRIAMARDAGGSFAFPDAGPRGGSILGIPLLVSRTSPRDSSGGQLALIDGAGIAANLESGRVDSSGHTTLEMSDDPENEVGAMVSMFQTNSVAWLAETYGNWETQRAGSVVVLTGVDY